MIQDNDKQKLLKQLELEKIVSRIAKGLINPLKINDAIDDALKQIGLFSHASRAYVFTIAPNGLTMNNTHEWCNSGVKEEREKLQDLPTSIFPWWISELKKGEIINIKDVSNMPEEASEEQALLQMQDIKSVLVLPIISKKHLVGFVGFDHIEENNVWLNEEVTILSLAADFFGHAFERLKNENDLKRHNLALSKAVETLKLAQTKLIQKESMAAIGQIAGEIAHEVNNPLGFLMSNHDILNDHFLALIRMVDQDKLNDSDKRQFDDIKEDFDEIFFEMKDGYSRVSNTVKGLKYFSNIDQVEARRPYNINEGITQVLMLLNHKLSPIKIETHFGDISTLVTDGHKLNQVFLQLMLNATDAIGAKSGLESGRIYIKTHQDETSIYVIVRDNGIGMTDIQLEKIYKPIMDMAALDTSEGIGMRLIRATMDHVGGSIDLQSNYNEGTEIILTVPVKQI